VAFERDHERKVRGERIVASREEKTKSGRDRDRRGGSSGGVGAGTGTGKGRGGAGRDPDRDRSRDREQVTARDLRAAGHDEYPFVETDATVAVRERLERWLAADRPVHLVGPTGAGKTALAMHVARRRDRPVVLVTGDAGLETADLVGEYAEEERESVRDRYVHNVLKSKDVVRDRWVDNPLTVAVREGATLVYNEFSRTDPAANNVLLSVFEEGVLELPGRRGPDRYVEVHPEFRAILTSNSVEYAGVHTPQDALLDRLVGIHLDFYDAETERAIVEAATELDPTTVEPLVATFRTLREELDVTVGTRAMVMAAEGLVVADERDVETVASVCVDVVASKVATREAVASLRTAVADAVADAFGAD
jgi:gas vesicle protein GvpN